MGDDALREVWVATTQHLESARRALIDPNEANLGSYRDYLDHNELGLAFECLVQGADAQGAPRAVWEQLALAAECMEIGENDVSHGPTTRVVAQHLLGA